MGGMAARILNFGEQLAPGSKCGQNGKKLYYLYISPVMSCKRRLTYFSLKK